MDTQKWCGVWGVEEILVIILLFLGGSARKNHSRIWVVVDDTLVVTGINGTEVTI